MKNPFASSARKAGPYWLLLFSLLLGLAIILTVSPVQAETPLVANISWSTNGTTWYTTSPITTSCGTTIYFRARNETNTANASTIDLDCPPKPAPKVYDVAAYSWDWNYSPGTHDDDAWGVTASKTYNNPGNRVVQLKVFDSDGAGKIDDVDAYDTVTVKVKLVLETDSMDAGGSCSAADHVPIFSSAVTTYMSAAWATANYTLAVDPDHDTDCYHYENIMDDLNTDNVVIGYLHNHMSEDPHLYIMGGHDYSEEEDPEEDPIAGRVWLKKYGMIFMFSGDPFTAEEAAIVMLHENACHDETVGEIGHCTCVPAIACCCQGTSDEYTQADFCSYCEDKLKDAQDLDN